jgi:phospholipid/cholesterol/gamma-HCH transport system substrate-binding protein
VRVLLRVALLAALIALVYVGVSLITKTPNGIVVRAAFTDAHGLVVGNDVRIDGATVGRVSSITLTRQGTALVRMRLDGGIDPLRADANAAIRPVDLLGDNYVALEPGHAAAPLRGTIPASRTLNDPSLDDLLRVFRAPERAGLKALLVSLGIALDDRGFDLNQAALDLRPTLAAADGVMQELGSQNADLRTFIADAQRVSAQGAARQRQLGSLVSSLASTVRTTAAHAAGLRAGLQTMPQTLAQARTTAAELTGTADAAAPLASELAGAATNLSTAATRLGPFLHTLGRAANSVRPTLRTATTVLEQGDPTIVTLAAGLRQLTAAAPATAALTAALVPAAPDFAQGFFVNFPDQASEPGRQPFDPFADPLRDYWRGAAVLSCQTFGVPIAPGCLTSVLTHMQAALRHRATSARTAGARRALAHNAPSRGASIHTSARKPGTHSSSTPAATTPTATTPKATAPASSTAPAPPGGAPAPAPSSPLTRLLRYLLAP